MGTRPSKPDGSPSSPSTPQERLLAAAAAGDVSAIRRAVADGAAINGRKSVYDNTALDVAVHFGHVAAVRQLLALGAHPDAGNAVHIAASRAGVVDVLRQLLDAGGAVNGGSSGDRPILAALAGRGADAAARVQLLLSRPDLDLSHTVNGDSLERYARLHGNLSLAELVHDEVGADALAVPWETASCGPVCALVQLTARNSRRLITVLLWW